jgi:hypothetical protein
MEPIFWVGISAYYVCSVFIYLVVAYYARGHHKRVTVADVLLAVIGGWITMPVFAVAGVATFVDKYSDKVIIGKRHER